MNALNLRREERGMQWLWLATALLGLTPAAADATAASAVLPAPPADAWHVLRPPELAGTIVDGVAAHVNGEALTVADVMAGARTYLSDPRWVAGRARAAALRAAYAEALGQLVNNRLILQAYRAGKTRLPPWVLEKRLAEIMDNRFDGDRGRLLRELSEQRLSIEDWKSRVEEQLIVAAMRQSTVEAHVQISPARVLEHYHAHAGRYAQPAATQVGLLLLRRREDEDEAAFAARRATVLQRLERGEAFATVAREGSDDQSGPEGGQWGWIAPDEVLRAELAQALAAMPVGAWQPVATPAGIYVIHKMAVRPAGIRALDEVRAEIERELVAEESQRLFLAWMLRLRSKAAIRTYDVFAQ